MALRTSSRLAARVTAIVTQTAVIEPPVASEPPKKRVKRAKVEIEETTVIEVVDKPPPKKRRKKNNLADLSFPPRVLSSSKVIGCHVSAAGGCEFAPVNASLVGARAFGLFLKNQKQWAAKNPLSEDTLKLFPLRCTAQDPEVSFSDDKGFDRTSQIVPHGNYLVNLAQPNADKWQKSYDCFLDDIQRAEALGIKLFNFHPGSTTGGCTKEEGYAAIAKGINQAHQATSSVVLLLENMAAKPTSNVIGPRFEDLRDVIALVEDKSRVGVCLDTCHAFAAGYDLRTPETYAATMSAFDSTIGLSYLKAIHCNDSKGAFESHRDLHQNIGQGELGLMAFCNLMADSRLNGLPFILETPNGDSSLTAEAEGGKMWTTEIALLYELERVVTDRKPEDWETAVAEDSKVQKLFQSIKDAVEVNAKIKEEKKEAKKAAKRAKGEQVKEEADSELSELEDDQ